MGMCKDDRAINSPSVVDGDEQWLNELRLTDSKVGQIFLMDKNIRCR